MTDYDEWRRAIDDMTEMQRAATETDVRHALGMCGDREDARNDRTI